MVLTFEKVNVASFKKRKEKVNVASSDKRLEIELSNDKLQGKIDEEIVSTKAKMQQDLDLAVATYIGNTFLKFQDRECVVAPYNFQYAGA